jgi:hypothetical protein
MTSAGSPPSTARVAISNHVEDRIVARHQPEADLPVGIVVVPAGELQALEANLGDVGVAARHDAVEDDVGHRLDALARLAAGLAIEGPRQRQDFGIDVGGRLGRFLGEPRLVRDGRLLPDVAEAEQTAGLGTNLTIGNDALAILEGAHRLGGDGVVSR